MADRLHITFTEGGVGFIETIATGGLAPIAEKLIDSVSGNTNHGWYCNIYDSLTEIKVSCWGATKQQAQETALYKIKEEIDAHIEYLERKEKQKELEIMERRRNNQKSESRISAAASDDPQNRFIVMFVIYALVVAAIIWLVLIIVWIVILVLMLAAINSGIAFLISGLFIKTKRTLLYVLSFFGAIYLLFDYYNGWLTNYILREFPSMIIFIQQVLYVNVTAGLIAAYFLVRAYLKKTVRIP